MVRKSYLTLSTLVVALPAFILVGLVVGSYSTPAAAEAELACEIRAKITKTLKSDYAELPVSAGLDNAGRMIEVFASTEGSWTILMTMPTGVSCLMATGENWMRREIKNIKDIRHPTLSKFICLKIGSTN